MSIRLSRNLLVSSGVALTMGALVQALAGFLAQLVLMRLLFPEDFGRFALILAGCGLVQTILSLRLNVLIIRLSDAEMTPERASLYRAALVWESVIALAVTLAWLGFAGLIAADSLALVAALALTQWTSQVVIFYERKMAYGRITLVETGSQMLGHGVAVALILSGAGAVTLYAREAVVALARLAAYARIGALSPPEWRMPRRADLRFLAADVRVYWLEGVCEGGFARLVVLCSGAIAGSHGTGLLAQSQRLALIPHQLISPVLSRLSVNAFSRADAGQKRRLLALLLSGALASLGVAALLAVAFADPVVPFLFGEHWRPAAAILAAMAGMVVFFPTFELLRGYCFALGLVHSIMWARGVQYAAFLMGAALAGDAVEPVSVLALALSAAYGAAFAVLGVAAFRAAPSGR
ncbi:colanic acid exporter [Paramagnetospirillum caucaseum]|uniref:Colanic acid exporter n=1 Tax=Paramagnetospirillum caucaseum TaxID=1244869 RepID=M3A8M7_9PROT|nr:oligosaccharide flippase family protein [Paramagnetospirillum caucaseum]EME69133.1 colanic acid exporter [Paramagnetospirillum caucaseum]